MSFIDNEDFLIENNGICHICHNEIWEKESKGKSEEWILDNQYERKFWKQFETKVFTYLGDGYNFGFSICKKHLQEIVDLL